MDHVEIWLFDLDNTLYPASTDLFSQIDVRMKSFIAEALGLPVEEAFRLQKQYYHAYGTSLRGLMIHHGVEPEAFLDYVHDIDHSLLPPDPALTACIEKLPGRRLIYTNGSERHAEKVLDRLGMTGLFEGVFDIKAANYIPKPHREPYQKLIERHAFDPRATAFFEDSVQNLKPAADLGMTTVLVKGKLPPPPCPSGVVGKATSAEDLAHCHHITEDLAAWLRGVLARGESDDT